MLLMASLAPAPHGTSASCVRCPSCLHYRGCATLVRKVHADCKSSRGILCERSVYKCADLGLFFTHPTVPTHLVAQLYANSAVHTATSTLKRLPRVLAQRHYIHEHLPLLSEQAVVVEVGCSTGWLLRAFDGPRRTLICFEPDASTAALANTSLTRGTQSSHVHVLPETFTIEALDAVLGTGAQIDLFLSSHVLEHLPDPCSFLSALHVKMAPGGAVFTELPNDTQERILRSPHDSQFHLSMTSPGGWLRLMENIGFVLGDLRTVRDFQTVGLNGVWSRSLLFKKNPADPSVVHGLQHNLSATRLAALAAPHADLCRHHADSLGLSVSDCIDGGFAGQVTAKPSFKGAGTQHVHRRVAHRSFSISSFAARLAAAETRHEPFEHLILNDSLPADCLSQMVENYPTDVTIDERCVSRMSPTSWAAIERHTEVSTRLVFRNTPPGHTGCAEVDSCTPHGSLAEAEREMVLLPWWHSDELQTMNARAAVVFDHPFYHGGLRWGFLDVYTSTVQRRDGHGAIDQFHNRSHYNACRALTNFSAAMRGSKATGRAYIELGCTPLDCLHYCADSDVWSHWSRLLLDLMERTERSGGQAGTTNGEMN